MHWGLTATKNKILAIFLPGRRVVAWSRYLCCGIHNIGHRSVMAEIMNFLHWSEFILMKPELSDNSNTCTRIHSCIVYAQNTKVTNQTPHGIKWSECNRATMTILRKQTFNWTSLPHVKKVSIEDFFYLTLQHCSCQQKTDWLQVWFEDQNEQGSSYLWENDSNYVVDSNVLPE